MTWSLEVDISEGSSYYDYSEEDRRLIDDWVTNQGEGIERAVLLIGEGVSVMAPELKHPFALSLDEGEIGRRVRQRGESLCRVTGASRGEAICIFDATGGLCREAHIMSSYGAEVWVSERSLPLYLIAKDALRRAQSTVQLRFGEAMSVLPVEKRPDVVYLDPMFPESKKKSAVGKEAVILRALATQSEPLEEEVLLTWAEENAYCRVVVKRPLKAPYLGQRSPTSSVKGKAIRFDLYGKRKLPKNPSISSP